MSRRETEDVAAENIQVGDELPHRGKVLEIRTISTVLCIKAETSTVTKNRYAPVTRYVRPIPPYENHDLVTVET